MGVCILYTRLSLGFNQFRTFEWFETHSAPSMPFYYSSRLFFTDTSFLQSSLNWHFQLYFCLTGKIPVWHSMRAACARGVKIRSKPLESRSWPGCTPTIWQHATLSCHLLSTLCWNQKKGNEDGNDDKNSASVSGSNDPIFDPMIQYLILSRRLSLAEEDQMMTTTALWTRRTKYLHVGLYIYSIKTILKMCYKMLYAKIGVLDLCCWNMKINVPVELIRKWTTYLRCTVTALSLPEPSLV